MLKRQKIMCNNDVISSNHSDKIVLYADKLKGLYSKKCCCFFAPVSNPIFFFFFTRASYPSPIYQKKRKKKSGWPFPFSCWIVIAAFIN